MASSIGHLELDFEDNKLIDIRHEYILLDERVKEDKNMLDMLSNDEILKKHSEYLEKVVGETLIDLHRGSSFYGTMDFLLLDAMRKATGLDIAFSNGWRYGGAIEKGKLNRRNLYQIVPMDPPIMTTEMAGLEICEMLEENLESTFSAEPFKQMGGYIKRNSGLKIYFKVENPRGHKIQKVFVGDEELSFDRIYKVAYVTRQGVPERFGKNHKEFGKSSIKSMEELLAEKPYDREDVDSYIPV